MNASEFALLSSLSIDRVQDAVARVRIVSRRNGVGLDRDVQLLRRALPMDVEVEDHQTRSLLSLLDYLPQENPSFGLMNLLVERIPFCWSFAQGASALIPNQERFPKRHLARLGRVNSVLCKSRHAEKIFCKYATKARYIGFTSVDRLLPSMTPDYRAFLHLAGRSTLKGTEAVLKLWQVHPEWPTLTLIHHSPEALSTPIPRNVHLISQYLDEAVLRRIQNQHGINICPSLSEGWGHYIVEGMSCRSVVVTTDAPPMNELVDSTRGFLVPWKEARPRHLGTNFSVDLTALEATINQIIQTSTETLSAIGQEARNWFESNQRGFQNRIGSAIDELLFGRS